MSRTKKEIIIEFEYLEQQIKTTSQTLDQLDNQASQLRDSISAVQTLQKQKEHDAKVPVVPGLYVDAKLQNTDSFLLDVGSDVAVPKTGAEAIEIFEFQLASTNEYQEKLLERLDALSKRADELQKELIQLQKGE